MLGTKEGDFVHRWSEYVIDGCEVSTECKVDRKGGDISTQLFCSVLLLQQNKYVIQIQMQLKFNL